MAKKPRTSRVIGELPPRGENSFLPRLSRKLPRMIPMISGRRYCTAPARCRPSAPAVSRMKHAMQNPMFAGFPSSTSTTAITPITAPAMII